MKLFWLAIPVIAVFIGFSQLSVIASDNDEIPKSERTVIEEGNFEKVAAIMKQNKLGLMIMFHAEYCDYCERLESDLLQPMVRSGDYDDKILIRKVQIDGAYDLIDFNGERISSSQLSNRYDASLTPTLIFLDADGKEQAERILGYTTPDLFGAYVDREINKLYNAITTE